jgi:hypothetical protein
VTSAARTATSLADAARERYNSTGTPDREALVVAGNRLDARYVERPSLRGTAVTVVLFAAVLAAIYLPDLIDGTLSARDLVIAPILGLVALPFAVLPWSKRRYHSITLTDDVLTVGRAQLPTRGLRVHEGDPPPGTPVLGGAFGEPLGWSTVVVVGQDGRPWRIATRRPAEFIRALSDAA